MNDEQRYLLKEIFRPSAGKVLTAVMVAGFIHYYLVADVLRDQAATNLVAVREFWFTNYLDALPYLETDNTFLKFLTFFVCSYLVVWLVTGLITLLENVQTLVIKRVRRTA
jgi:hypothetical protein